VRILAHVVFQDTSAALVISTFNWRLISSIFVLYQANRTNAIPELCVYVFFAFMYSGDLSLFIYKRCSGYAKIDIFQDTHTKTRSLEI